MQEERMMILNMLAEGKITPAEAEKLLNALSRVDQGTGAPNKQWSSDMEQKMKDFSITMEGWAKEFSEKVDETVKEVEPKLRKITQIVVEKTSSAIDEISKEFKKQNMEQQPPEDMEEDKEENHN